MSLDGKVVILPLESARKLLGYEKEVTAYELRCDASVVPGLKQIQSLVGDEPTHVAMLLKWSDFAARSRLQCL